MHVPLLFEAHRSRHSSGFHVGVAMAGSARPPRYLVRRRWSSSRHRTCSCSDWPCDRRSGSSNRSRCRKHCPCDFPLGRGSRSIVPANGRETNTRCRQRDLTTLTGFVQVASDTALGSPDTKVGSGHRYGGWLPCDRDGVTAVRPHCRWQRTHVSLPPTRARPAKRCSGSSCGPGSTVRRSSHRSG